MRLTSYATSKSSGQATGTSHRDSSERVAMEHALEVSQLKRKIARLESKIARQSPARTRPARREGGLVKGRDFKQEDRDDDRNDNDNGANGDSDNGNGANGEESKVLSRGARLLAARKLAKERQRKTKEIEKAHGEELESILQEREDALRREFEGQKSESLAQQQSHTCTNLSYTTSDRCDRERHEGGGDDVAAGTARVQVQD